MTPRAVVIGAGVDALVCAHLLARAGHAVTCLREYEPVDPPECAAGWLPPGLVRELGLESRGYALHARDPWLTVPLQDGSRLELSSDVRATAAAIGGSSARDAAKWPAFCERMRELAGVLEFLYAEPPPDPLADSLEGLAQIAKAALRVRRLGKAAVYDLLRILPMSIADLLDEWFEDEALKGALGAAGVMHLAQGPRSAGTAFNFLHHHVGSPAGVFRPPRSNALEALSALPGIEIRDARGERIDASAGAVEAVALAGGERIDASLVVSAASPRRTLTELLDPGWLDPELVRAVRHIRSRGVSARVRLTLAAHPGFGALCVAPSLDYLERAYDAVKYARTSEEPYLEAHYLAPAGDMGHRADVRVQFVPHAPNDGAWDAERSARFAQVVVDRLGMHVPTLRDLIVDQRVETPAELEHRHGLPEGQAYHAEIALDQMLWMRPAPELARYRTPIRSLYLCGPAMHPGVAGATGANAARIVLEDLKRKKV